MLRRALNVRVLIFVTLVVSASAVFGAQKTAASPKPAAAVAAAPAADVPAKATTPVPVAPAPDSYSYDPAGRRDPFMNLLGVGSDTSKKGDGASSIAVADISVRGVLQSRTGMLAMVAGPDSKTYIVHQGDRLLDGSIKTITTQGLIIEQEVNDPLSVVKQREVRRLLRGFEDAK
jgi:type IV pilus assembly protein PilP